jgi:hypothetical protein
MNLFEYSRSKSINLAQDTCHIFVNVTAIDVVATKYSCIFF